MAVKFQIAEPFEPLFQPARYKVFYGGRGGAKSWAFARACQVTEKKIIMAYCIISR